MDGRVTCHCRVCAERYLNVEQATAGLLTNVLLIAALFVIGDGLVRTGIAYQMGDWLCSRCRKQRKQNAGFLNAHRRWVGAFMSSTGWWLSLSLSY